MKKICKKLIICLMVVLILFNFLATSGGSLGEVYATDDDNTNEAIAAANEGEESANGSINGIGSFIEKAFRALVVIMGSLIQSLGYFVMSSGGTTTSTSVFLSPFDIFFDTFTLTNVNVFTTDDLPTTSTGEVDTSGIVYSFRSAVSGLFWLVSGVAIAILFVLVAIAFIRKFLESTPEKKKNASDAIMDCFYSFILIMFIDTFIILIFRINSTFIDILREFAETLDVSNFIKNLRSQALSDSYLLGWGCTIAFVIVCWQTFKFGIAYIMRFFMVSLLVIIAPLMGLFYSHSKSVKGMPGAFNKWFKLFLSNLFIQVIDAMLYILCVAIPLNGTLSTDVSDISGLAGAVMLIAGVMFVKQGEKVLMKLLGLEDSVISMNSVSNGISKAVNTVTSSALTGVAIAQGNYSVMNVTNSPVSFGNDVSGGAAGTAGVAGIAGAAAAGAGIHQAGAATQQEFGTGSNGVTLNGQNVQETSESRHTTQEEEDRSSIDAAVAATGELGDEDDEEMLDDLAEQSDEQAEDLQDQLDEDSEELADDLQGKLDENTEQLGNDLQDKIDELGEGKDNEDITVESNETNTESENDTFEREETSTDTIHMVAGDGDGKPESQDQKAAADFVEKHDSSVDKQAEINKMYEENWEKYKPMLEEADKDLSPDESFEIQKKVSSMLTDGKKLGDGIGDADINKVKDYINSLGSDTAQGKMAAAALGYNLDKAEIDALYVQNRQDYRDSVDDAVSKNVITKEQGNNLKYHGLEDGANSSSAKIAAEETINGLRQQINASATTASVATTATVGKTQRSSSSEKSSANAEPVFDRGTLREVYNRQDTKDTLNAVTAPLRTIKETNPKLIDGKVDVSFNRVSEIVGKVEAKYDYDAELAKITDKIKAEGEESERTFAEFENAKTIQEQTEAAKKFTTQAQAEGAQLIVEKQIGSVMVSSVVASQTATSNMEVSQQNSSTRNVLDQLAQRGAQDATTKK